jgi:hypothetical protein
VIEMSLAERSAAREVVGHVVVEERKERHAARVSRRLERVSLGALP